MKAMILAAGVGKRLRPLTSVYPKVLVPVVNKPVVDRVMELLKIHGVREIIINAHHHHQKIVDHLNKGNPFGMRTEVRVEKEILGTGGGIKNTQDFWGEAPFIVINGDILTDIDLRKVYEFHLKRDNLITMVLHDFPVHNKIRMDNEMNILSIGQVNTPTLPSPFDSAELVAGKGEGLGGGEKWDFLYNQGTNLEGTFAYTGIQVMNPEVLDYIPENKRSSIIECYRRLIDSKKPIKGYLATGHRWIDIGTIADYLRSNFSLLPAGRMAIAPECHIDPDAVLMDWAVTGRGCSIERGAFVKGSVLWNDAVVKQGVKVVDSVVASGVTVEKDLVGGVAVRQPI